MNSPKQQADKKYYKVLDKDGKSNHGGDMIYSLPFDGNPGEWHEVSGRLEFCENGLHLTCKPVNWAFAGCRVFEVEYGDEFLTEEDSDKICVRKSRLVKELLSEELWQFGIYYSGNHSVSNGKFFAGGNATVRAWDNATVRAGDNATVEAGGNATVRALDNATVRAGDNATVEAWDNATVEAGGNATVRAWDNATVRAGDNATVEAGDNATVEAGGNATVRAWDNATVRAWGNANLIFYHTIDKITLKGKATAKHAYDKKLYVKKSAFEIIEL